MEGKFEIIGDIMIYDIIQRVSIDGNDKKPGFTTAGLSPEISSFEVRD